MRVLVVTKIFPNAEEPLSSPFNRRQFGALSQLCDVTLLATLPWFPGAGYLKRFSRAGRVCDVPRSERIDGMDVHHPRFLYVPRAPSTAGPLYALSLLPELVRRRHQHDVVLASWAYPDGYAAIRLARALALPCVVKLHGSDMDVVARMPGPRRQLARALPQADRVVAVSGSLARSAQELGVSRQRIDVVGNGVDRALFQPRDRAEARAELGIDPEAQVVLYVGRLHQDKGVHELLDAFVPLKNRVPAARLVLVGDGPRMDELRERARPFGDAVLLAGACSPEVVARWMNAADLVTLPSHHEGMPNVLREALACGKPVVATRVGGIPELVDHSELGTLVDAHDVPALTRALAEVLERPSKPRRIVELSRTLSWDESGQLLFESLQRGCAARQQSAPYRYQEAA